MTETDITVIPAPQAIEKTETKPVEPCTVESIFDEKSRELIAFVSTHVKKMENDLLFEGKKQPSFYELNTALCSFEGVLLALIPLYEDERYRSKQAKEVFDIWFADKFISIRDRENQRDLAAAKWLSAGEIEKKVIAENKEEYSRLRADVIKCESQESTMRRLMDGWSSYQFILSNLCKNAQSELNASISGVDGDESTPTPSY
jgi:hypothetical protein